MPAIDRSLSDCRYWGMQGGALCQAKHAKCDKGAKPGEKKMMNCVSKMINCVSKNEKTRKREIVY